MFRYIHVPILILGFICARRVFCVLSWCVNTFYRKMDNLIQLSSKTLSFSQTITFSGTDDKNSSKVVGQNVTVYCHNGSHNHGSSKVKLKNIVDYNWEHRLYAGQLLAVHMAGKYIAYGIKVPKVSVNAGMVRVANTDTDQRSLLRGMRGQIQDISFAHIPSQIILACVDEDGTLFVHNIETEDNAIICTLMLHVIHKPDPSVAMFHRVIWCPYIPEDEQNSDPEDDVSKLLVLTQGCKAEMWNVSVVNAHYGVGPHNPENVVDGFLEIFEHTQPIIDATFAPDGTALATASLDGEVKFFQVYMHNDSKPRCLHEWKPHNGNGLSCLFFLDDHHAFNPEVQFWKFAVTGCNNNSELKIWSCESWTCLQTIHFKADPTCTVTNFSLKAGLDHAAGYLLLSDIYNRMLYVLQIHKDLSESSAYVCFISEFLLPSPILSFGIVDAGLRKIKCSSSTEDLYQLHDGVEIEDGNIVAVVIRMYIVQPKSLQECHIVYEPNVSTNSASLSTITHDNLMFREGLTDVGSETDSEDFLKKKSIQSASDSQSSNQLSNLIVKTDIITSTNQPLNLMTPDAFNSPVRRDSIENSNNIVPISMNDCVTMSTSKDEDDSVAIVDENSEIPTNNLIDLEIVDKENFASGGSSPSREVQEILSLNPKYSSDEFYDEDIEKNINCTDVVSVNDTETLKYTQAAHCTSNISEFDHVTGDTYSNTNLNHKLLKDDGWPNIPIMKADEVRKSEEGRMPNNHVNIDLKTEESDLIIDKKTQKDKLDFKSLSIKVDSLTDLLQQQNSMIMQLQEQMALLATQQSIKETKNSTENESLIEHIDEFLIRHNSEQNKMIENWMKLRANKEREYQECLMSSVSQVISNNLLDKLDKVVSVETQKSIIPAIVNILEPLAGRFHAELAQKLTATDHLLKDNINKLIHSKSVMELLGSAIVTSLRPSTERCYKELLGTTLITSWERICQNMFQQMHESFTQGTKEYTTSLENYLEKHRRSQEKGKDLVTQLQTVSESMRNNFDHSTTNISIEIQQQIQKSFASFQEIVKKNIRQEVKEQIEKGFRNHAAVLEDSVISAVKSRAVTPSPHLLDSQVHQTHIQQLLSQGQINAAFQQALSAADLSLVVYTCEKVNPQELFSQTPCPIQQHVLLSLIQQLSADMSTHTDLKYKYLEEAVMNLQATNPLTREHLPVVLKDLQRQLTSYIACNPNQKISRQMRMLLMATHSLLQ